MELRWLIHQNNVTAKDVQAAVDRGATMPRAEIAKLLIDRTVPALQYRQGMGYEWEDVPTIVLPHPTNT